MTLIFLTNDLSSFADSNNEALLKSDYKKAYTNYKKALEEEKTAENYLNMCKVTFLLRDDQNAKLYCKSALNYIEKEKHPDKELQSNIYAMLGSLYLTVYHNNDITFEYLNQAKELKEKNPDTDKYELVKLYRNLAYMYNYTGNNILSGEYYQKALSIAENEKETKFEVLIALIYNDLALIERRRQNYTKTFEYLVLADTADKNSGDYINYALTAAIYNNIARYYEFNKHDKKTAIEYYQKAEEANGKFPDKDYLNKSSAFDKDNLDAEELTSNYEKYPYDSDTNLKLALYFEQEQSDKSESYINKAIMVNPQNPYVYAKIAAIYAELYNKEPDYKSYLKKATQYIKMAEEKGKYSSEIYFMIGDTAMKINSTKDASKYFKKYLNLCTNKLEAVNRLQLYFSDEKFNFPKNFENDILK